MADPRRCLPRAEAHGAALRNGFGRITSSRNGHERERPTLQMRWRAEILLVPVAACASAFAWASDSARYNTVRIIVPQVDVTVHDNEGNLDVSVEVSPPLRSDAGDHIVLLLDGRAVASG